jgi:periplasmic protein TonB
MPAPCAALSGREPALPAATRNTLVLGVLGVHVAAAWGLLQIESVREAADEVAPLFVSLLAPSAPSRAEPAQPTPVAQPRHRLVLPAPDREPAAVAAPAAAPTSFTPAAPVAEPAQKAPVLPPTDGPVASHLASAEQAEPRSIPAADLRYVVQLEPAYPAVSRRLGEAGEVHLRAQIGTDGRARQISVHQSSGFPRLDESAMAALRAARFAPHLENGVALVVWTIVPVAFELRS